MDGSGDNPQILQIPVHLPGYTQCFTRILPAFYLDISSVLPGHSQCLAKIWSSFQAFQAGQLTVNINWTFIQAGVSSKTVLTLKLIL